MHASTEGEDDRSTCLIALDWGTSSLRAYRLGEGGAVLEARTEPWGITQLPPGGFSGAFEAVAADWRRRAPRAGVVASGMIGSAQGWEEAPYCPVPAGALELARNLVPAGGRALLVVPGIVQRGDRPDVMRGEETQIIGALCMHPELSSDSVLLLPGTHSKWAHVSGGRIRGFSTYMTGELFAVLSTTSILGRLAREAKCQPSPEQASDAFARGVLAARDAAQGIAPLLFSARALVLTGMLAAETSLEYLSGLLIGDEVRCGLATGAAPSALIGDAGLCARYRAALAVAGAGDVGIIADAAPAGLWEIAQHAVAGATTAEVVA